MACKVCYRGNPICGEKIIQILKSLGGINVTNLRGKDTILYYYIDSNKHIRTNFSIPEGYTLLPNSSLIDSSRISESEETIKIEMSEESAKFLNELLKHPSEKKKSYTTKTVCGDSKNELAIIDKRNSAVKNRGISSHVEEELRLRNLDEAQEAYMKKCAKFTSLPYVLFLRKAPDGWIMSKVKDLIAEGNNSEFLNYISNYKKKTMNKYLKDAFIIENASEVRKVLDRLNRLGGKLTIPVCRDYKFYIDTVFFIDKFGAIDYAPNGARAIVELMDDGYTIQSIDTYAHKVFYKGINDYTIKALANPVINRYPKNISTNDPKESFIYSDGYTVFILPATPENQQKLYSEGYVRAYPKLYANTEESLAELKKYAESSCLKNITPGDLAFISTNGEIEVLFCNSEESLKNAGYTLLECSNEKTVADTSNLSNKEEKTNSIINNKKENKMKNVFGGIMSKFKSQFVPEKVENLKISSTGLICVPSNGEYVAIDANNNLVSFTEELCFACPIYTINKPADQVLVGDIIKDGNTYGKVVKKKDDGSFSVLSYSGTTKNRKAVKDFILNSAFATVVVNMFSQGAAGGFNPMMLMMMDDENNFDMKDMMMMQMMSGQGGQSGINPMMMALMMKGDGDKDSSMIENMMMMQMMQGTNGTNPFGSMFGGATPAQNPANESNSDSE